MVGQTIYSKNSINKCINEKLLDKYVFHAGSRTKYRCEGVSVLSNEAFLAIMSQSSKAEKMPLEEQFYEKLVGRSLDAFTLASEFILKVKVLKVQGYESYAGSF